MRNFDEWFKTMRPSINGYDYYTDFGKVYGNIDAIRKELCILDSLVGSKNIEDDFRKTAAGCPEIIRCIPELLAVRSRTLYASDENRTVLYDFSRGGSSIDDCCVFMRKTGLFDLLANHIKGSVFDYCLGVEAGLDSNARKNRGGQQMESLVERFLAKTGLKYYSQVTIGEAERRWNIDLSPVSAGGTTIKRFDFALETGGVVYLMETNFYGTMGSKQNETARSYKMIAEEMESVEGAEFVWITDGANGWRDSRRNLKETFDVLPHIYNISDLEDGIFSEVFSSGKGKALPKEKRRLLSQSSF